MSVSRANGSEWCVCLRGGLLFVLSFLRNLIVCRRVPDVLREGWRMAESLHRSGHVCFAFSLRRRGHTGELHSDSSVTSRGTFVCLREPGPGPREGNNAEAGPIGWLQHLLECMTSVTIPVKDASVLKRFTVKFLFFCFHLSLSLFSVNKNGIHTNGIIYHRERIPCAKLRGTYHLPICKRIIWIHRSIIR